MENQTRFNAGIPLHDFKMYDRLLTVHIDIKYVPLIHKYTDNQVSPAFQISKLYTIYFPISQCFIKIRRIFTI